MISLFIYEHAHQMFIAYLLSPISIVIVIVVVLEGNQKRAVLIKSLNRRPRSHE